MKREEDSLIQPPLEDLLEKIPQKYELVLAATRRAKQILRENRNNALEAEGTMRKPLSVALEDIVEGRIDKEALLQPDLELDNFLDDDAFGDLDKLDDIAGATADDAKRDTTESDYIEDDDLDDIDLEVDLKLADDDDVEAK